jgi:hypothetical protein
MRSITKRRWILVVAALLVSTAGFETVHLFLSPARPPPDPKFLALAAQVEPLVADQLRSLPPDSEIARLFGGFQTLVLEKNDPVYTHKSVPYSSFTMTRTGIFEKGQVPVRIEVPTNAKEPLKFFWQCFPHETDLKEARDARIISERGRMVLEYNAVSELDERIVVGRRKSPFVIDIVVRAP